MEINDFNDSYKKQSSKAKRLDSEKTKNTIDALRRQVVELTDAIEDLETKKTRAERDKNTAGVKEAEQELKAKKAELKKVQAKLTKIENSLNQAKTTVDNYIDQIAQLSQNNPELKAQLDAAIKTKFERAVARNNSEIEKIEKQVEPLKIIKNAAQKDPQVSHILLGMEEDYKNMEFLQALSEKGNKSPKELEEIQEKIAEFSKQREAKKSKLAAYFKGTISKADIDRITYLEDLDKEINSSDRKIARLNNQNANYETALKNLGEATQEQTSPQKTSILNRIRPGQGVQPVQGVRPVQPTQVQSAQFAQQSQLDSADSSGLPATKPKWYQFIKRFKNYRQRKAIEKAQKQAQAGENGQQDPTQADPTQALDSKSFKDALKYDVVRDYKDRLEHEYLKNAKAQNKAAKAAAEKDADEKDGPEL